MRRLARQLAAEADHGGTLPSPALNAACEDGASAQVAVHPMPLAA